MTTLSILGVAKTDFLIPLGAICGIGPDALDYRVLLRCK